MGIILTSTGLPLLTSTGAIVSPARAPEVAPVPVPKPEPGEFKPLGPTTSISYRGVTFTFSNQVYWLESANGDPVVITDAAHLPSGTTITAISPPSAVDAHGDRHSGAVINPFDPAPGLDFADPKTTGQGWDKGIVNPAGEKQSSFYHVYNNALDVDPANTRRPITVRTGDAFCLVKSVRDPAYSGANNLTMIQKYVPLTFMDSPPPRAGTWFRPGISAPTKAWPARTVEEMDLIGGASSPLRNLQKPGSLSNPSVYLAEIAALESRTIPVWGVTGNYGRRAYLTKEAAEAGAAYARNVGCLRGEQCASLFIGQSGNPAQQTARESLARILIQWGIDNDGAHQAGQLHSNGAGQHFGYLEFHYLAAFMLGDAAMLDRASVHKANSVGQLAWIQDHMIGYPVNYDPGNAGNNNKRVGETYRAELIDKPEWIDGGWQADLLDPYTIPARTPGRLDIMNASWLGSYRDNILQAGQLELMCICLLRNGPNLYGAGPTNGDIVIRRNGAFDKTNIAAASIAFLDRVLAINPWSDTSSRGVAVSNPAREMYALWRDQIGTPVWSGAPDMEAMACARNFSMGTGSGQIAWALNGYDHSTMPVDRREVQYSQDGVQFFDIGSIGTASSYMITGLRPGTLHWNRWRQRSAGGWSPWSQTWPQRLRTADNAAQKPYDPNYHDDRGRVLSGGTQPSSGTPTNVIAPAIWYKPYIAQEMPYYEPAPADLTDVLTFFAGIGYWMGGTGSFYKVDTYGNAVAGNTAITYQWQRNTGGGWSNIATNGTGKSYTRTTADRGAQLRCAVTVGGVTAHTNTITIPTPRTYPSTTLIDTEFGGRFQVEWPTVWANIQAAGFPTGGFVPRHQYTWTMPGQTERGALWFQKNASSPSYAFDLSTNAPDGTYNVVIDIGMGYFPDGSVDSYVDKDVLVQVRDGANAIRGNCAFVLKKDLVLLGRGGYETRFAGTFTISGGNRTVRIYIAAPGSSSGGKYLLGGPVFATLSIKQGT